MNDINFVKIWDSTKIRVERVCPRCNTRYSPGVWCPKCYPEWTTAIGTPMTDDWVCQDCGKDCKDEAAATLHICPLRACPCLHVEPCQPRCTCVDTLSSSGCLRCCSYGSPEQQKVAAKKMVVALRVSDELRQMAKRVVSKTQPVSDAAIVIWALRLANQVSLADD